MNSKILLTNYTVNDKKYILTVNRQFDRNFDLDFEPVGGSILGNIYVGIVKDIAKNINAAFIQFTKEQKGYLSLENVNPIFLNRKNTDKICEGDYILVQVEKEPIKTKDAVLTTNISIPGKYSVISHGKDMVGFSNKIKADMLHNDFDSLSAFKEQVSEAAKTFMYDKIGFIIRTEAAKVSLYDIKNELEVLNNQFQKLLTEANDAKLFTCVYTGKPSYISLVDKLSSETDEIITDNKRIYDDIIKYLGELPKLKFYEDNRISLNSLYNIDTTISEALSKKVWLKSGGFLIIEQTEAMTVIDVNTGKYEKGKDAAQTFLKINKEAASEIGRQIRLRNLSGIIITDFIDSREPEHDNELMAHFENVLSHDPVKTVLVDITKLGLVEVTRKKIKTPISQIFC